LSTDAVLSRTGLPYKRPTGSTFSAFGFLTRADFDLPADEAVDAGDANLEPLELRLVEPNELETTAVAPRILRHLAEFDGCPYAALEGPEGELFIHYGSRARFHLLPKDGVLRCAPANLDDPLWQRVLLDTVLWTTSYALGSVLIHAAAVETRAGVVALLSPSGGGKTTLAAELLSRGAGLVADDVVTLRSRSNALLAFPGPPVINLPGALDPARIPGAVPIAEIGGETWVRVERRAPRPAPLKALVMLDRTADRVATERIDATTLSALPFAVGIPTSDDRTAGTFEVLGELAARTPVLEVRGAPSSSAADLGESLLEALECL
jgi:hypothetical protein